MSRPGGWAAVVAELATEYPQPVASYTLAALAAAMEASPNIGEGEIRRKVNALLSREYQAGPLTLQRPDRTSAGDPPNAQLEGVDSHEKGRACHDAIEDELGRAARLSEREILAAGERIANIHKFAGQHAGALKTLSAEFGESQGKARDGFTRILSEQEDVLAAFSVAFDTVCQRVDAQQALADRAGEHTSRILDMASAIKQITATLNILGVNALISASQAGQHEASFSIIARELRKLAARANSANNSIADLAKELTGILPALESSNGDIARLCRERANKMRETVASHSESLRRAHNEMQTTVAEAIQDATNRGESIANDCNDLLSHLMFQDRLQQHIMSALKIAELWLSADAVTREALPDEIQRMRVGTERLARHKTLPAAPGDTSAGPEVEAGELSFL